MTRELLVCKCGNSIFEMTIYTSVSKKLYSDGTEESVNDYEELSGGDYVTCVECEAEYFYTNNKLIGVEDYEKSK